MNDQKKTLALRFLQERYFGEGIELRQEGWTNSYVLYNYGSKRAVVFVQDVRDIPTSRSARLACSALEERWIQEYPDDHYLFLTFYVLNVSDDLRLQIRAN